MEAKSINRIEVYKQNTLLPTFIKLFFCAVCLLGSFIFLFLFFPLGIIGFFCSFVPFAIPTTAGNYQCSVCGERNNVLSRAKNMNCSRCKDFVVIDWV
ncbi:hypothetical protein [Chengkuizengella axinellae]|uniref:LITAF domain-containing protein n=1 Tax=Chengkuizengella axinellae TaxID=3064388 RepID=A0ABT9IYG7_9BACL|nr:hypothetical protein [Chengkuizengella sp. 2205SS18-9]MDP5274362.1 hypothetical protein [Chengkuizengella sp. 2205SS18-9]